jgi:raffinose/stachyose/melibiose transport system permease protein
MSGHKKRRYFLLWYIAPAALLYAIFMLIPILQSLRFSLFSGKGLIPDEFVGLNNYVKLFTQFPMKDRIINVLGNNFTFFFLVMIFQNVFGFALSVLLTRKVRGSKQFRILFFIPTALSAVIVGFIFKLILNPVWGIFNIILEGLGLEFLIMSWLGDPTIALPVISIVTAWHNIGIPVIFFTAGIDSISDDLIDASRIDGVTIWGEIRHLIIPITAPIIGIVTILTFVGNFSEFEIVYSMQTIYANPEYSTDIFGSLFYRTTFGSQVNNVNDVGLGATIASVMFFIIFLGVMVIQRVFRRRV